MLALQGAFIEHEEMLSKLGVASFEIRKKNDLMRSFDGLIIPGGESTVQGKLLKELDLLESIRQLILEGLPTFGTCAGLLLLSKRIENDARSYLATMDITAVRGEFWHHGQDSDDLHPRTVYQRCLGQCSDPRNCE